MKPLEHQSRWYMGRTYVLVETFGEFVRTLCLDSTHFPTSTFRREDWDRMEHRTVYFWT